MDVFGWAESCVLPKINFDEDASPEYSLPQSVILFVSELACEMVSLGLSSPSCPLPYLDRWLKMLSTKQGSLRVEVQKFVFKAIFHMCQQHCEFEHIRELLQTALSSLQNKAEIMSTQAHAVIPTLLKHFPRSVCVSLLLSTRLHSDTERSVWISKAEEIDAASLCILQPLSRCREAIELLPDAINLAFENTPESCAHLARCLSILKVLQSLLGKAYGEVFMFRWEPQAHRLMVVFFVSLLL